MSAGLQVESAGMGAPLVLLHGWAMHSGIWGPLLPALATRFRVHAPDLPGHGRSEAISRFDLESLAVAMASRFDGEREPLTVLGWSLGASVALRWAGMRPERVKRLVLVAATPRFVASADWPYAMAGETLARFGDELRISYRLTLQRFLSLQLAGSDEGRAVGASLRRALFARGEPAPAVLSAALALLAREDLRPEIPAIRQPALVIAGERDMLTPPAAGAWLAAALPHARFVLIPGAAHVPFLSHPAAFLQVLDGFIGGG